jgi:hypothetical protein
MGLLTCIELSDGPRGSPGALVHWTRPWTNRDGAALRSHNGCRGHANHYTLGASIVAPKLSMVDIDLAKRILHCVGIDWMQQQSFIVPGPSGSLAHQHGVRRIDLP